MKKLEDSCQVLERGCDSFSRWHRRKRVYWKDVCWKRQGRTVCFSAVVLLITKAHPVMLSLWRSGFFLPGLIFFSALANTKSWTSQSSPYRQIAHPALESHLICPIKPWNKAHTLLPLSGSLQTSTCMLKNVSWYFSEILSFEKDI